MRQTSRDFQAAFLQMLFAPLLVLERQIRFLLRVLRLLELGAAIRGRDTRQLELDLSAHFVPFF
jgi:hypothetical protein